MNITMGQIVAAAGPPNDGSPSALDDLSSKEMNSRLSLKLARVRRKLQENYADFMEAQNALVKKHASEENPNQVAASNIPDFAAERDELLQEEVEVELPHLGEEALEGLNVKPATLDALLFLFEEPAEE